MREGKKKLISSVKWFPQEVIVDQKKKLSPNSSISQSLRSYFIVGIEFCWNLPVCQVDYWYLEIIFKRYVLIFWCWSNIQIFIFKYSNIFRFSNAWSSIFILSKFTITFLNVNIFINHWKWGNNNIITYVTIYYMKRGEGP